MVVALSSPGRLLRACVAAGIPTALLLGLVVGTSAGPAGLPRTPGTGGFDPTPSVGGDPYLVASPATWWTVSGNTTELRALWEDTPFGCSLDPVSVRWAAAPSGVDGTFSPPNGTVTNFTASSVATGEAHLAVHGVSILRCPTSETVVQGTAFANVSLDLPPRLGPITIDPDPAVAGEVVNLTVPLSEGTPPYLVRVVWGDGNDTTVTMDATGPSFSHRYPAGTFAPYVTVIDSAGLAVNASVDEPETVTSGFSAGIRATAYAAEVGFPDSFAIRVLDTPIFYESWAACSDSTQTGPVVTPPGGPDVNLTCTFAASGRAEVTYRAQPLGMLQPELLADLSIPVAPPLTVSVDTNGTQGEVGRPAAVAITISGGVPPFALSWGASGNSSLSNLNLSVDGTVYVPIDPVAAGLFGVSARVQDARGADSTATSVPISFALPLSATVRVAVSSTVVGDELSVTGTVTAGYAPFQYLIVPALVPPTLPNLSADLPSVSTFEWNATLGGEGNSSVVVAVFDAAGAAQWSTFPLALVTPPSVSAVWAGPDGTNPRVLALDLSVRFGLAPFRVWVNASSGASWNGTAATDGRFSWSIPVSGNGTVSESLILVDALGGRWSTATNVTLLALPEPSPPAAPRPEASSDPEASIAAGLSIALIAAAAGVAYLYRRRRRSRTPAAPGPDPVPVLQRIIEPADGVDRTTVELLAEEEGVPLALVRSTIDRLIADGTLRSETGSDGEEVLAWSRLPSS